MELFFAFLFGLFILTLIVSKLLRLSKHETLAELTESYNCVEDDFCKDSEVLYLMYLAAPGEPPKFITDWAYRGTTIYCIEEGVHIKMNLLLWSRHFFIPWQDITAVDATRAPDFYPLLKLKLVHCTKPIAVSYKLESCKYWKLNVGSNEYKENGVNQN